VRRYKGVRPVFAVRFPGSHSQSPVCLGFGGGKGRPWQSDSRSVGRPDMGQSVVRRICPLYDMPGTLMICHLAKRRLRKRNPRLRGSCRLGPVFRNARDGLLGSTSPQQQPRPKQNRSKPDDVKGDRPERLPTTRNDRRGAGQCRAFRRRLRSSGHSKPARRIGAGCVCRCRNIGRSRLHKFDQPFATIPSVEPISISAYPSRMHPS
jgi:hypothetical protein